MITNLDIHALLPHVPPMLMVSEIIKINATSLQVVSHIKADNPFIINGSFAPEGCIEFFSQAAGLLIASNHKKTNNNNISSYPGLVVRLKSIEITPQLIPIGAKLNALVNYLGGGHELGIVDGHVNFADQVIFNGSLSIALLRK